MKILGGDANFNQSRVDEIRKRGEAANAKSSRQDGSSSEPKSSETVAVSGAAREIGKVSARVRVSPDIRKEKVDEIKDKIDKGEYYVDGDKIAGKIIEDIIKQAK